MEGTEVYSQPKSSLLNAINDIIELQKGKVVHSDTPNGQIWFLVRMYSQKWEFRFTVSEIGANRSTVHLEINGNATDKDALIRREFALLDSLMQIVSDRSRHTGLQRHESRGG
jgi:hypothetical protein